MEYGNMATASGPTQGGEDGRRAGLTPGQRLTLLWSASTTALVLLTGIRLAADGWWALVVAWLQWPFPGWVNLLTTALGVAIAVAAWFCHERVEGMWRIAALAAAAVAAAVSLFLIACAVVALIWLIWCRLADDDDESSTHRARARRHRRRRRRPYRSRY